MRHPYTQALLGSIPKLSQDNRRPLVSIPGIPPDLTSPPAGCRFAARCPYATDQCRAEEPPLDGVRSDHLFACWHPVNGPATTTKEIAVHRRATAEPDQPSNGHLLEIVDAVREYPVTAGAILQRKVNSVKAVSGVNLHVDVGEALGLVGESGCGKTTLGKLIVGIEKPDSGRIALDGNAVFQFRGRKLRKARRDRQMVSQAPCASLDPGMRVNAILREPLKVQSFGSSKEQDER